MSELATPRPTPSNELKNTKKSWGREENSEFEFKAALTESEQLEAIFDVSTDIVFLLEADGCIRNYRAGSNRLLYLEPEQFLGKRMQNVLPEEVSQKFSHAIQQLRINAEPVSIAYSLIFDGEERYFVARLSRHQLGLIIVVVRDVTEIERARLQLEKANARLAQQNKKLERFAFAASHDLQEPLRTILGICMFMKQDYSETLDAAGIRWLEDIEQRGNQLSNLIKSLLEYSRLNACQGVVEEVDLNELVDDVWRSLQASVDEAEAQFSQNHLPTISGDRSQLTRLFQNLISNALKFRHADRVCKIRIVGATTNSEVTIGVCDNGIGIPASKHADVFEVFRKLHHKNDYPGSGIGLSLCSEIMENHGGRIEIDPIVHQGTMFVLTFPM